MYYNYWEPSSSFVIKITVADRLCTQDGIWNTIAYNDTVYAFCTNGNGVRYRQCVLDGVTTSWGEINSSMCDMSLLSSEPEKGHAFIQFYLTYLEKNPDDYTAKNMFALYSSLFTYFESEEIHVDGLMIRIESISSLLFYDDKGGSTIHVNWSLSKEDYPNI